MLNMFNKLSNKVIYLILAGLFLIAGGTVVLYIYRIFNETIFTIVLFVCLMAFSTFTSVLMQRSMMKKMDKKRRSETYTFDKEIKFLKPLKEMKVNYGHAEIYLENKTLYSLFHIKDGNLFFSEEQESVKFKVDTKKYDKAIQFYLFDNSNIDLYRKITILNYQAEKFYVASFLVDYENKTLYQTDNVARNEIYEEVYQDFLNLIGMKKMM